MIPKTLAQARFLSEEVFIHRLHLEQKRTERSQRPFILVLLESASLLKANGRVGVCQRILDLLLKSFRETDVLGWYQYGSAAGLIFTEVGPEGGRSTGSLLTGRVRELLAGELSPEEICQVRLSFFVFPEDWDKWGGSAEPVLYPETVRSRRYSKLVKRLVDIGGSLIAILLGSPLFFATAAAIKLTSRGPVLFRQQRVGQFGRRFTLLKFRSMRANNDHTLHQEYVKNLIAGTPDSSDGLPPKVFKLTGDPRITQIGRFLRKTSVDEMPQFLNVLRGEMSLVGPRPPIPYEVDSYEIWHRRRLLAVKPGITGLWQVNGRSRTTFDEMVRLDLQYAKFWSVWLDLRILLQTPGAVIAGDGAY